MNYFSDQEDARKFISKFHPIFPDVGLCKTKPAFGSYWSCLVEENFGCPYKFGFGFDYLCRHSDNLKFAADRKEPAP